MEMGQGPGLLPANPRRQRRKHTPIKPAAGGEKRVNMQGNVASLMQPPRLFSIPESEARGEKQCDPPSPQTKSTLGSQAGQDHQVEPPESVWLESPIALEEDVSGSGQGIEYEFVLDPPGWSITAISKHTNHLEVCTSALQSSLPGYQKKVWEGIWEDRQDCLDSLCAHFDFSRVSSPLRHAKWLLERTTGAPKVQLLKCYPIRGAEKREQQRLMGIVMSERRQRGIKSQEGKESQVEELKEVSPDTDAPEHNVAHQEEVNTEAQHTRYWSWDEHQVFAENLERYGRGEWVSIAQAIPTKTADQVRSHAQKYFLSLQNGKPMYHKSKAVSDEDTEEFMPRKKRPQKGQAGARKKQKSSKASPDESDPYQKVYSSGKARRHARNNLELGDENELGDWKALQFALTNADWKTATGRNKNGLDPLIKYWIKPGTTLRSRSQIRQQQAFEGDQALRDYLRDHPEQIPTELRAPKVDYMAILR
eukprot:TRINITY_DN55499_c0_g1_i2.p1 TRINITY_DN55499_c0_g1~~TRINITY_DN55499_c0_g1_i2.p1  ORF type:complete len:478 (-),score=98.41 TRINITY_DN55499_c0_g1_i2:283-1716(-)